MYCETVELFTHPFAETRYFQEVLSGRQRYSIVNILTVSHSSKVKGKSRKVMLKHYANTES